MRQFYVPHFPLLYPKNVARVFSVELGLASDWGSYERSNLNLKRFARISLALVLAPVQPWEHGKRPPLTVVNRDNNFLIPLQRLRLCEFRNTMRVPSDYLCEGTITCIPDFINFLIRQSFVFTCHWKVLCASHSSLFQIKVSFQISSPFAISFHVSPSTEIPVSFQNSQKTPPLSFSQSLSFPKEKKVGKNCGQVFWAKISFYLPITYSNLWLIHSHQFFRCCLLL